MDCGTGGEWRRDAFDAEAGHDLPGVRLIVDDVHPAETELHADVAADGYYFPAVASMIWLQAESRTGNHDSRPACSTMLAVWNQRILAPQFCLLETGS